jgi:hypothetical protein
MRIYVFASDAHSSVVGVTSDETGANLPAALGPWREEAEPGVVVIDTDGDLIALAVRRYGFFVSPGQSPQPAAGTTMEENAGLFS